MRLLIHFFLGMVLAGSFLPPFHEMNGLLAQRFGSVLEQVSKLSENFMILRNNSIKEQYSKRLARIKHLLALKKIAEQAGNQWHRTFQTQVQKLVLKTKDGKLTFFIDKPAGYSQIGTKS